MYCLLLWVWLASYLLSGGHSFYHLQPHTKLKAEELALERFYLKGEALIPDLMEKTKVSEFTTRNPVALRQGTTVKEALETFKGTNFRVLPVVSSDRHVTGVVTLEDLGYVDVRRQEIGISETVMHKPVLVDENVSLRYVAKFMVETEQDHVFIVDGQRRLIGVVSGIDVIKKILELLST